MQELRYLRFTIGLNFPLVFFGTEKKGATTPSEPSVTSIIALFTRREATSSSQTFIISLPITISRGRTDDNLGVEIKSMNKPFDTVFKTQGSVEYFLHSEANLNNLAPTTD
jgi:hypothetical protein